MCSGDKIAPEGKMWVCLACGKISKDCYGTKFPESNSRGWDASCVLNCKLFDIDKLTIDTKAMRVTRIED